MSEIHVGARSEIYVEPRYRRYMSKVDVGDLRRSSTSEIYMSEINVEDLYVGDKRGRSMAKYLRRRRSKIMSSHKLQRSNSEAQTSMNDPQSSVQHSGYVDIRYPMVQFGNRDPKVSLQIEL
jgi:hypothetical protein